MSFFLDGSPRDDERAGEVTTMDLLEESQARMNQQRDLQQKSSWHGLAFVLEAVLLLLFLGISLAVICGVLAGASNRGDAADQLSEAIVLTSAGAENSAEAFAADPTATPKQGIVARAKDGGWTTVTFYHDQDGTVAQYSLDEVAAAVPNANVRSLSAGEVDAVSRSAASGLGAGTFMVTEVVSPQSKDAGTLYRASITISVDGEAVYAVDTARYVSERGE